MTIQRSFAPGTPDFPMLRVGASRAVIAGLTLRNGRSVATGGTFGSEEGGAIHISAGNVTVRDCLISENTGARGGAIGVNTTLGGVGAATVALLRCKFINNSVGNGGGAIYTRSQNANLTVTADQCVFQGNTATDGGAVHVDRPRTTTSFQLTDCSFSGNMAATGGGLYVSTGGESGQANVTMKRCTISANSATGSSGGGDAIRCGSADPTRITADIENCTFDGNEAYAGGAIDNIGGARINLRSATIADNHARSLSGGGAGGIVCSGFQTCQLWNSIVAGNMSAGSSPGVYGFFLSRGYNLIGRADGSNGAFVQGQNNDQVGSVAAPLDPILGPLADNGGLTFTRALRPGSPALDKGNNFGTTTDQRGWLRPYDMPGVANASGGDGADIGAYEVQALAALAAASRKTHGAAGAFDISLPLAGEPGVECRSSDGNHSLVFTFTNDLASGSASVTTGVGSIQGSPSFNGRTATVNLSGVSDAQRVTVTMNKVSDEFGQTLPSTAASVNMLIGDINASKVVTASDIGQVKASSGVAVTSANFRADVVVSGEITASDIGLVKLRSGQFVP